MCLVQTTACAQAAADSLSICRDLAEHMRSAEASVPDMRAKVLEALMKADPDFMVVPAAARSGRDIAEELRRDREAAPDLIGEIADLQKPEVIPLSNEIQVLDQPGGTANCNALVGMSVAPDRRVRRIDLPFPNGEAALCGVRVAGAMSKGAPTLIVVKSSANEDQILLSALHDDKFAPPCEIVARYGLAFSVEHAFCRDIDCVPVMKKGLEVAVRLADGSTPEVLGAEAGAEASDQAARDRKTTAAMAEAAKDVELPTFGAAAPSGYTQFSDAVSFPISLGDGAPYVVRLGHAHLGLRESPDYLMAVYRLKDDALSAVAGLYIAARRREVVSVDVK